MAADSEPDTEPWYRSSTAVFTAGGVGLALVGALVFTVVQMSDDWSKPLNTDLTTTATTAATTTSPERQPFIATLPETSTTTFTTSVRLSTTDIGVPSVTETTTSGTETTSGSPTTSATTPTTTTRTTTTEAEVGAPTTRKRPRLNETRTLSPGP